MPTQLHSVLTVLLAYFSAVSAWKYYSGTGFGEPSNAQQAELFNKALQNPNATKSFPGVLVDWKEFTFHINIVEYTPTGADTNIKNPRVVNTAYSFTWTGVDWHPDWPSDINDTMRRAQGLTITQNPRLCVNMALGPFSAATTNGWDSSSGNGSCEGALSNKCYSDLTDMSFSLDVGCTSGFLLPDSCSSADNTGGWGSESLTDPSPADATKYNLTTSESHITSPYTFGYWASEIYEAGNGTAFQRETERMHMIILSGKTSTPVCGRVKDDDVSSGDPSASSSSRKTVTGWFVFVVACATAMLML